jgi:hypothetical protein
MSYQLRLRRVRVHPDLKANLIVLPSGAVAALEIYIPLSSGLHHRKVIPIAQWPDYEAAGSLIPHEDYRPFIWAARDRINAARAARQERP